MRSQWKRLAWAALLSCACFAATLLWYNSTEKDLTMNSGEEPLAQVSRVGDEVLKKPPTRLLWQSLNTGDYLYNNETIRTSHRGEIRIQFDDGSFIDLEPDSLVVLQKSKGEIALDLMEGSVFVNAQNTNTSEAPQLVLNSAGNKVDLRGASASLSKTKGSGVDLQVLQGTATIQGKDGKSQEISQGESLGNNNLKIEIISPSLQKPVYLDPEGDNMVSFQWKGFPQNSIITIMGGPNRKELKSWGTTSKPGITQLETKVPIGRYYWKLVAKDPTTKNTLGESSVYRTEILARYAPTMVFPVVDADIPVEKFPATLTLKWQKGEEARNVTLEVATDRMLKTKVATKTFTDEQSFNLQNLRPGEYFWRLSAFYPDSKRPIVGKIQKFRISQLQKKEPVRLTWALPENMLQQHYTTDPQLQLAWTPENRQEEIVRYRFVLADEEALDQTIQYQSQEPKFKANLPKPGRYLASIEAFDKEGNLIGKSDATTLSATELPLLAPTQLIPAEGVLKSASNGQTQLHWEPLEGAVSYQLIISNSNGKELLNKRYPSNSTNLRNLLPGQYTIRLMGVDKLGRIGEAGEPRTLIVPNMSDIQAPKLKKIKVN